MKTENLTIENICGGTVAQRLNDAIQECLVNLADPELDFQRGQIRMVTLKIKISCPDLKGDKIDVDAAVDRKLIQPPIAGHRYGFSLRDAKAEVPKVVQGNLFERSASLPASPENFNFKGIPVDCSKLNDLSEIDNNLDSEIRS